MKGFKATNKNMKCRGFQFELDKLFKHKGKIEPCVSGFHFCKNIENIKYYYDPDCRIFEVVSGENNIEHDDKVVTNEITFLKEIDYSKYINHQSHWLRAVVAHKGVGLDVLINDDDPYVRCYVAKFGYGLDRLVNDSVYDVRRTVAQKCYRLDLLVHDPHWVVRREVANQGYGLEQLINDIDPDVRVAVAEQKYGLDILIKDPNICVRYAAETNSRIKVNPK